MCLYSYHPILHLLMLVLQYELSILVAIIARQMPSYMNESVSSVIPNSYPPSRQPAQSGRLHAPHQCALKPQAEVCLLPVSGKLQWISEGMH